MTQLKYNSHPIPPMSYYVKLGILCPLSPGGGSKFFIPMNIFKTLWNAKRQILFSLLSSLQMEHQEIKYLAQNHTAGIYHSWEQTSQAPQRLCLKESSFPGQCLPPWDLTVHTWIYSKGLESCKERRAQLWPRSWGGGVLGKVRPDLRYSSKRSCLWVRMLTEMPGWSQGLGTMLK